MYVYLSFRILYFFLNELFDPNNPYIHFHKRNLDYFYTDNVSPTKI